MESTDKQQKNIDFSEFTGVTEILEPVLKSNSKDEASVNMSSLDSKVVKALQSSGHAELASTIEGKSDSFLHELVKNPEDLEVQEEKHSSRGFFSFFGTSMLGFFSILLVGFGVVYIFFPETDETGTELLSARAEAAAVTLQPKKFTSSGHVAQDNEFEIAFTGTAADDIEDNITIEPPVKFAVDVKEDNGKTVVLVTPETNLERSTEYKISLAGGVILADGSDLSEPISWTMMVEPDLQVLATSPRDSVEDVALDSQIEVSLSSSNVTIESFADNFVISPEIRGEFTRIGNKMVFMPTENFAPNSEYEITITNSLSDDSESKMLEDYAFSFKTGNSDSRGEEVVQNGFYWSDGSTDALVNSGSEISLGLEVAGDAVGKDYTFELLKANSESAISEISKNHSNPTELATNLIAIAEDFATESVKVGEGPYVYTKSGLENGVYVISVNAKKGSDDEMLSKIVVVSDLEVVYEIKDGKTTGIVYSDNDLVPVKGAQISAVSDSGTTKNIGTTDESGKFSANTSPVVFIKSSESTYFISDSLNPSDQVAFEYDNSSDYETFLSQYSTEVKKGEVLNFDAIVTKASENNKKPIPEVRIVASTSRYLPWYDFTSGNNVYNKLLTLDEVGQYASDNFIIPFDLKSESINVFYIIDQKIVGVHELIIADNAPKSKITTSSQYDHYLSGESVVVKVKGLSGNNEIRLFRTKTETSDTQNSKEISGLKSFGDLVEIVKVEDASFYSYQFTPYIQYNSANNYTYTVVVFENGAIASDHQVLVSKDQTSMEVSVKETQIYDGGKVIIDIASVDSIDKSAVAGADFEIEVVRNWVEYEQIINESSILPTMASAKSTTVFSQEELKTDENGLFKMELNDLAQGSYTVIVKYSNVMDEHDKSFHVISVVPQLLNEAFIGGYSENKSVPIPDVNTEVENTSKSIFFGYLNSGDIFTKSTALQIDKNKSLDFTSMGIKTDDFKVLCLLSLNNDKTVTRSCVVLGE